MDLETLAENRFDASEAEANGQGGDNTPPSGDNQQPQGNDPTNNNDDAAKDGTNSNGDENNGGAAQENDPSQTEKKDGDEGKDPNAKDGGQESPETPELTDEQLLEELKKRGLDKPKEDEPKKPETPQEIARPDELPDRVWNDMNPVQRTIYNELPYVKVQGKDGNVLEVKTPEQLPADFEFANARAEAQFNTDMSAQSYRAEKMYESIQTEVQQRRQASASQAESQRVVADVDKLQKDGIVPKIAAKSGTPEFDKDPGVVRANEILAYWQELRKSGENISVYTAGKLYKAEHPELYTPPKQNSADEERKQVSRNIAGGGRGDQSQANSNNKRPVFRPGTSASDIVDYYDGQLD